MNSIQVSEEEIEQNLIPTQKIEPSFAIENEISSKEAESPWKKKGIGFLKFIKNSVIGGVLCQSFVSSVLVLGWVYRFMQRVVLKSWWKKSPLAEKGVSFEAFMAEEKLSVTNPNWFMEQSPSIKPINLFKRGFRKLFHSFKENLRIGIQAIFNIWVLTLPASGIWLASWYMGWNTSFNKVYEQAEIGALNGLLGIFLFILVMFYVPFAQTRQAVTGNWRVYYHFRVIWQMIRQRWFSCLVVAGVFSLISFPFTIMKIMPAFFSQIFPEINDMSDVEALKFINTYFFWVGVVCFLLLVSLHYFVARIYASSFLALLQKGNIAVDELTPLERHLLERLELIPSLEEKKENLLIRVLKTNTKRITFLAGSLLTFVVWFSFVAQIYLSEFIVYHHQRGWLNQPLVQLPCFRYVPSALEEAAKEAEESAQ